MYKSSTRSGIRIGLASLTLLLAVATFQTGAVAANATPTAPTGNAMTPEENFVNWVYYSVLFRAPDEEGFGYWTDQVEQNGPGPFVHAVVEGQEWREVWVDFSYQHWLDREVDDGGVGFWSSYLATNRFDSFETFLASSDEAYEYSGETDEDYVDYVYFGAAFRSPTVEEQAAGVVAVETGSRSDFVHSVLHSEDGMASRVEIAYDVALRREPDPDGAMYWAGYYHATGSLSHMQGAMLLSPEAWEHAQDPPTFDPDRTPFTR